MDITKQSPKICLSEARSTIYLLGRKLHIMRGLLQSLISYRGLSRVGLCRVNPQTTSDQVGTELKLTEFLKGQVA